MSLDTYTALVRCLGIVPKLSQLSALTKISKATLAKIADGGGNYKGCHSTRLRLLAFVMKHSNKPGRPFNYNQEEII